METRSIAIGLVAVVAAFAAAFGVAKSGGSKTENAGAGVKAQSINVAAPAAVAGVEVGGTLPALKADRKAPKKKKHASNTSSSSGNTTTAPETDNTTPPAENNNTTPPANNNTTPPANNNTTPPANNNNNNTEPEEPASGGFEDG